MKKRFIFDENYIKRYANKDKIKWLIIGVSALILIVIIIIVILSTSRRRKPVVAPPKPVFELKEELNVAIGSNIPDVLDYFNKLENIDIKDIKITYPEEFEVGYDMSTCTDEEIEKISNKDEYKIEDFPCAVPILKTPGVYGITLTIKDQEYTINLNVADKDSPVLVLKDLEIFYGDKYNLEDFIQLCTDVSGGCNASFYNEDKDEDGKVINYAEFTEPGEYTIKIIAEDTYGNVTDPIEAKLTIVKPEAKIRVIKFNSDGGTKVGDIKVVDGGLIAAPIAPKKEGYKFLGWYFGNIKYDFTVPVDKDITLTAKWEKENNDGTGSGNENPPSGGNIDVSSIYLDYLTIYLTAGESKTVKATIKPSNAQNKTIKWSSSDTSIAKVNEGKITGVKNGTATITAKAGGKTASVKVIVRDNSSTTCKYGDATYNKSYILSVNLIKDGCAANPNMAYTIDSVVGQDYQKAITELGDMGFKINSDKTHEYKSSYVNVKNKAGTGLVGKQITITINVIDQDNPYIYMTAEYIIKPDGSRQFIKNNIKKNNIKFGE